MFEDDVWDAIAIPVVFALIGVALLLGMLVGCSA